MIVPEIQDPDDPTTFIARFVPPAVPMPDDCAFQLAPDDELVLRVFNDGSVEFGPGISLPEAAMAFWRFLESCAL